MSRNLTTALVDDLRARIVDGRIAPGERLPSESSLIAEHGVSRTVVREAVARLRAGDPLAASAAMRLHLANSLWRLEAEAGGPVSRTAVPVED